MRAGIDLGTTNSLIARLNPTGFPIIIPDNSFRQFDFTPSSVYLGDGTAMVGIAAEAKLDQDPSANIIRFFKRSFGQQMPLVKDLNGNDWYAESLAALVLKKLVYDYESQTGESLKEAVITVPAHFNDTQRKSVIYAANMADIPLKGILEEPYAAALHYGVQPENNKESVLFVYDLGGGTFDASVISLTSSCFQVLAKDGHSEIGGKEFDEVIMSKITETIGDNKVDWNIFNVLQLRKIAEEVKKELSNPSVTFFKKQVVIGNWFEQILFNRLDFEAKIEENILQTIAISKRCIIEAGLSVADIDAFLLVGGAAQVPYIKELLIKVLEIDSDKVKLHQPMRAIAYGAALHLAQLNGELMNNQLPPEFKGVTGFNIGIKTINPQNGQLVVDTLIHKNYPLPSKATRIYYTKDDQQDYITLELVQYLDQAKDSIKVGIINIGPILHPRANYMIEVSVENTTNGTISVKAYDPQTGKEIAQSFTNRLEESVFMLKQQTLVRNTIVNNI